MEKNDQQTVISDLLFVTIKGICKQIKFKDDRFNTNKKKIEGILSRIGNVTNVNLLIASCNELLSLLKSDNIASLELKTNDVLSLIVLNANISKLDKNEVQKVVDMVSPKLISNDIYSSLRNVLNIYYKNEKERLSKNESTKKKHEETLPRKESLANFNVETELFIITKLGLDVERANINYLLSVENKYKYNELEGEKGFVFYDQQRSAFIDKFNKLRGEKPKYTDYYKKNFKPYFLEFGIENPNDVNTLVTAKEIKRIINSKMQEELARIDVTSEEMLDYVKRITMFMSRNELIKARNILIASGKYPNSELIEIIFANLIKDRFANDEDTKKTLYDIELSLGKINESNYTLENMGLLDNMRMKINEIKDNMELEAFKSLRKEIKWRRREIEKFLQRVESSGLKR